MVDDDLLTTWRLNGHDVPGIWRYLLPRDIEHLELPEERRATCLSCPKVISDNYDPQYKCCTYHPRVPNFLLGLGLSIPSSRPYIVHHIEGGYVVPEGANSSPQQWLDAVMIGAESTYGKSEVVRCSFLEHESGRCGIYSVRNSVCSSFFCLNDHGQPGSEFWDRLQEFVSQIESALAQWCLEQLGFDINALMATYNRRANKIKLLSDPVSKSWRKEIREELFGDWFGRETDLFWRCGDLVREHKDDLYEIARSVRILEPQQFEEALVASVPDEASSGVDASYHVAHGEPAQLDDMWYVTKLANHQLWQLPSGGGLVRLNPDAAITIKDPDEKMSLFYTEYPMVVTLIEYEGEHRYQWRQYLSVKEANALKWFITPRLANAWMDCPEFVDWDVPQKFIAEWMRKNVLQWVVKH